MLWAAMQDMTCLRWWNRYSQISALFAHPGRQYSHVNVAMKPVAHNVEGLTYVDLYSDFPRFDVNVAAERARLLAPDVIVVQFPFFGIRPRESSRNGRIWC